ncbi:MAG: ATP-binding cassette domain-containing protein, partial [Nevskiales bacterium]
RYAEYRKNKAEALEQERESNREFDKQLAQEEEWLRRGVKARTKRNMGRVREIEKMREEVAGRRKYHKRPEIRAQFGEATGKRVIEAFKVSASIAGQPIVTDFSLKIQRGHCIGVMGPNGCGKSSLLRLLLGEIKPESGNLKYGENLQIAYFDQNRSALDLERTAAWNVADGAERIDFEGKSLHVLGYLKAFLFTPERAQTAVKLLSGGERNRLLLARLFAQPSNVLILDEPTNDLDVETLELLEGLVNNFPGTVILVSHDRAFVDAVVDGILVYEPGKGFDYNVGNYEDWQRQDALKRKPNTSTASKTSNKPKQSGGGNRKLSYRDQRELDALPEAIESLENDIDERQQAMADPEFFQQDADSIKEAQIQLAELQKQHDGLFERWQELEALQQELKQR